MSKDMKGIIVVLVVAGIGYIAYKKFLKPDSRKVVIKYLDASFGGSHSEGVKSMEKGYVDSWSKAIMSGSTTFNYNGKTYVTMGGKIKN